MLNLESAKDVIDRIWEERGFSIKEAKAWEVILAAIAEKDREIERLKETTIDVWIKVPKEDSDG